MLRDKITRIAQANIQEVLVPLLERIEALEEAMDAKFAAPEVVKVPEIVRQHNNQLLQETLEGENDYVQRHLEDEECEELETNTEPEVEAPAPESSLNADDLTEAKEGK